MLYRQTLFAAAAFVLVMPPLVHAQEEPKAQDGFDEKMVERLKKVLEASPQEGFVLDKLLSLYKTYKSADVLIAEYEAKSAAEPNKASLQLVLGLLYKAVGRDAEAKQRLEAVHAQDPKNTNVTIALAGLAEKANNVPEAKKLYEEALGATTDKISKRDLLRRLVKLNINQKDIDKAREYAQQLTKSDPSNIYLAMEFPQALVKAEFYEEAIKEFNKLLASAEDGKTKVAILKEIGAAYEAKKDMKQALIAYEKALSMTSKGNSARAELREIIAAAYRKEGDTPGYIAMLEREPGKGFDEYELLGRLYEEIAENEKAILNLEKAISLSPKHLEVRERLIRIYDRIGETDKSVVQYRELIKAAPGDPRWPIALAQRLNAKGQKEEALKILGDMRRRYASDPSVRVSLASLYNECGEYQEELKEYEALVKLEPKEEAHLITLGERYWQPPISRQEDAKATWKKLLTVIPEADRAYAVYADTMAEHLFFEEAITAYKTAIEKNPNDVSHLIGLASAQERASPNKKLEAIKTWQLVLKHPKANKLNKREARERIVHIYKEKNLLNDQIREAKKAFEKEPPDTEQGAFLALAYTKTTPPQEKEAIAVLQRLASLDPKDPEPLRDLVAVYDRRQELEAAIPILEKLALLEPIKAKEHYQKISEYLTRLRRDEEAVGYAEKALALSTSDASAFAKLGEIYHKQGKDAEAIAAYEKAISLDRRSFENYFALADLYAGIGRTKDAIKLLQDIIARASEDAQVTQAAKRAFDLYPAKELTLLEKDLLLLYHTPPSRKVYRRILVDLYWRMSSPLINTVLYSEDEAKRQKAQETLVEMGGRAMLALSETLADPDDPNHQKAKAAEMMGYLKNTAAVLPLSALLQNQDPDGSFRILAALSLGRLADKAAVSALGGVLGGSFGDPVLRAAAAWALGEIKSPTATSFLLKKRQGINDSSQQAKVFSILALAKQGDKSVAAEIATHLDPRIESFVAVRQAAALALGVLASKDSIEALRSALEIETQDAVRGALVRALGAIGDESVLPKLLEFLYEEDKSSAASANRHSVSAQAAFAISHFGQPLVLPSGLRASGRLFALDSATNAFSASEYISDILKLPSKAQDASALLLRHKEEVERSLKDAINSNSKQKQFAALDLLDRSQEGLAFGDLLQPNGEGATFLQGVVSNLAPQIIAIVEQGRPADLTALATRVLGKAREKTAVEALRKIVQEPKFPSNLRAEAAIALGRINREESLVPLRALAKDADWAARFAAARAFGESKDPAREADLLPLLEDPEVLVQSAAVKALLQIGGGSNAALPVLERVVKKPNGNWPTRKYIVEIASKNPSPKATEILKLLADDKEPHVASEAKAALAKRNAQ